MKARLLILRSFNLCEIFTYGTKGCEMNVILWILKFRKSIKKGLKEWCWSDNEDTEHHHRVLRWRQLIQIDLVFVTFLTTGFGRPGTGQVVAQTVQSSLQEK